MKERDANQRSNFGLPEMTCPRARVEIPLDASRGQDRHPSSFVRGEIAAHLRCGHHHVSFFEFNAIEHHARQGITQSKGEEVRAGFLFPVRKPPAVADDNFAKTGAGRPRHSRRDAGATICSPDDVFAGTFFPWLRDIPFFNHFVTFFNHVVTHLIKPCSCRLRDLRIQTPRVPSSLGSAPDRSAQTVAPASRRLSRGHPALAPYSSAKLTCSSTCEWGLSSSDFTPYSYPFANAFKFSSQKLDGTESATDLRTASGSSNRVTAVKNPTITEFSTMRLPSSSASRVAGQLYTLVWRGKLVTRTRSCSTISVPPSFNSGTNRV